MQYFETTDTFGDFLKRKISDRETPKNQFEVLIASIYKQRFRKFDSYSLSLIQEAQIKSYSDARDELLTTKGILLDHLAEDMLDITLDISTVYEIGQSIEKYSAKLKGTVSRLIEMMHLDTVELQAFPDPTLYREAFIEESSRLEGEAQSMKMILSRWMQLHKYEVHDEKARLTLLAGDRELSGIIGLMHTTGALMERSSEKVIATF